jgi:hypothetical protein
LPDSDGDGVTGDLESSAVDTDRAGTADQYDSDDDSDGAPTDDEDVAGEDGVAVDSDGGDGMADYEDDDADGNHGVLTSEESDRDGDGSADSPLPDADDQQDSDDGGEGIGRALEGLDSHVPDAHGDGVPDRLAEQRTQGIDSDGVLRADQNDRGGDGEAESALPDSDGDGVTGDLESSAVDTDRAGTADHYQGTQHCCHVLPHSSALHSVPSAPSFRV